MAQIVTSERLLARTETEGDCQVWRGKRTRAGYGRLNIGGRETYAHRAMMAAVTGRPIPDDLCVLHSCDNKPCINPNHLRIGTHAENMADAQDRGQSKAPPLTPRGSDNPNSRLTPEERSSLEGDLIAGMTAKAAAAKYGVSSVRCCQIRKAIFRALNPHLVLREV